MKILIRIISALAFIAGICLAIYLGLYLCLFGGVVQIIEAAKLTPVDSSGVAFGIVRVLCTGIVFGITFWVSALLAAFGFGVSK